MTRFYKKIKKIVITSNTVKKTVALGKKLAKTLYPGAVVLLTGKLGTGKTTFTQGLVNGLGYTKHVTSPTFKLLNIYSSKQIICHIDLYRLTTVEDLESIGYPDCLNQNNVVVIEWADKIKFLWPKDKIVVDFKYINSSIREIKFRFFGNNIKKFSKFRNMVVL